jgi:Protein of unknown function (DUF3485)
MLRTLPMTLAILLLMAGGLVNGIWIDRWNLSSEPGASAAKMEKIPEEIGEWKAQSSRDIDDQSKAIGEIAGYLSRVYSHSGRDVACLIVCGRPGAIGAHTPDVCFVGQNQIMLKRQQKDMPIGDGEGSAQFYTAIFKRTESGISSYNRAFWSWSADGVWSAPENPRLKFLGKQVLYKLYVTYPLADEEDKLEEGAGQDFINVLLPKLHSVLFGNEKQNALAKREMPFTFANIK